MCRVTVDSNIYVSALQFRGLPLRLIEMAGNAEVEVAISSLRKLYRVVTPTQPLNVVKDDPDDDAVVECAVAAGSEVIVTGDKHLLRLGEYDGIQILQVREFLERGSSKAGNNRLAIQKPQSSNLLFCSNS